MKRSIQTNQPCCEKTQEERDDIVRQRGVQSFALCSLLSLGNLPIKIKNYCTSKEGLET